MPNILPYSNEIKLVFLPLLLLRKPLQCLSSTVKEPTLCLLCVQKKNPLPRTFKTLYKYELWPLLPCTAENVCFSTPGSECLWDIFQCLPLCVSCLYSNEKITIIYHADHNIDNTEKVYMTSYERDYTQKKMVGKFEIVRNQANPWTIKEINSNV